MRVIIIALLAIFLLAIFAAGAFFGDRFGFQRGSQNCRDLLDENMEMVSLIDHHRMGLDAIKQIGLILSWKETTMNGKPILVIVTQKGPITIPSVGRR